MPSFQESFWLSFPILRNASFHKKGQTLGTWPGAGVNWKLMIAGFWETVLLNRPAFKVHCLPGSTFLRFPSFLSFFLWQPPPKGTSELPDPAGSIRLSGLRVRRHEQRGPRGAHHAAGGAALQRHGALRSGGSHHRREDRFALERRKPRAGPLSNLLLGVLVLSFLLVFF